jgi:hypothetical protein
MEKTEFKNEVKLLIIGIINLFVWPFILMKYYYWFMPHIDTEYKNLDYSFFVAVLMLIQFFYIRFVVLSKSNNKEETSNTKILAKLIVPWLSLGLAYLVYVII